MNYQPLKICFFILFLHATLLAMDAHESTHDKSVTIRNSKATYCYSIALSEIAKEYFPQLYQDSLRKRPLSAEDKMTYHKLQSWFDSIAQGSALDQKIFILHKHLLTQDKEVHNDIAYLYNRFKSWAENYDAMICLTECELDTFQADLVFKCLCLSFGLDALKPLTSHDERIERLTSCCKQLEQCHLLTDIMHWVLVQDNAQLKEYSISELWKAYNEREKYILQGEPDEQISFPLTVSAHIMESEPYLKHYVNFNRYNQRAASATSNDVSIQPNIICVSDVPQFTLLVIKELLYIIFRYEVKRKLSSHTMLAANDSENYLLLRRLSQVLYTFNRAGEVHITDLLSLAHEWDNKPLFHGIIAYVERIANNDSFSPCDFRINPDSVLIAILDGLSLNFGFDENASINVGDRKAFFEKFAQRCPLAFLEKALECSKHVPFVLHCLAYKLESSSQDTRDKVLALLNAYSFSHWKEIRKSIVNNDDAWAFLDNDSEGIRFLKRVLPEKEVPTETQRTPGCNPFAWFFSDMG